MELPHKLSWGTAIFWVISNLLVLSKWRWHGHTSTLADVEIHSWFLLWLLASMLIGISYFTGVLFTELNKRLKRIRLTMLTVAGSPLFVSVIVSFFAYNGRCAFIKSGQACHYFDYLFKILDGFGLWTIGVMAWFMLISFVWLCGYLIVDWVRHRGEMRW